MSKQLEAIEDKASEEYVPKLAEVNKHEKDCQKYKVLDEAALAVTDLKCGKSAAEAENARSAAIQAKKEAHALRDKVNNHLAQERLDLLAKNKRLTQEQKEEQATTLEKIANSLPSKEDAKTSAKRARQDASINQLLVLYRVVREEVCGGVF
ncbi:hypothetical protein CYMTET_23659 [Cymbomonas tetramitiformis]|uniref:Uncharacterized protein n=1 Tax=Cymbomonas tetramitiformis TaxID=36881 RepID=A0AAE0FXN8_9CHLO|nr:hypothetical protein CYMTET_23659 [Cymbomonas tetramitiformis]